MLRTSYVLCYYYTQLSMCFHIATVVYTIAFYAVVVIKKSKKLYCNADASVI